MDKECNKIEIFKLGTGKVPSWFKAGKNIEFKKAMLIDDETMEYVEGIVGIIIKNKLGEFKVDFYDDYIIRNSDGEIYVCNKNKFETLFKEMINDTEDTELTDFLRKFSLPLKYDNEEKSETYKIIMRGSTSEK